MKTSRVTRRVVRRWALRIRRSSSVDLISIMRLGMPWREREVVGALVARESQRRRRNAWLDWHRAADREGYPCSVDGKICPCGSWSEDCR